MNLNSRHAFFLKIFFYSSLLPGSIFRKILDVVPLTNRMIQYTNYIVNVSNSHKFKLTEFRTGSRISGYFLDVLCVLVVF